MVSTITDAFSTENTASLLSYVLFNDALGF